MTPPAETSATSLDLTPANWGGLVELVRRNGRRAGVWGLPFVLVVYLGLKGGGYDAIIRSEVGVGVWWIVLLGAAIGVLPGTGLRAAGWAGLGLLAAFGLWTGLGIAWSSDAGASATEFARVMAYLGVLALVLTLRQPGDMRRLVNGLTVGLAVIGGLALLSRLHPAWFPDDDAARVLGETHNRLSYPIGYWNGLATLMAMGAPLLLYIAVRGRTILGRASAAGAMPAVALTAFFTLSRGGALELVVALLVFLALAPRRLAVLPSLLLTAVGSAILIIGANQRDPLVNGLVSTTAHRQGNTMLAMAMVVCCGVALIQAALALAEHRGRLPKLMVPTRTSVPAAILAAVVGLVILLAASVPGYLADRWHDFKTPTVTGTGVTRFDSSSGSGRYQTWTAASDAYKVDPATGIGPGTFESWWAQKGTLPIFVRDAHSLYMETLGELGVVGLLLIGGFIGLVLGVGANGAVHGNERRWPYAAATASVAAFVVGAGIDWAWEQAVIPIAFLVLAGGLLGSRRYEPPSRREALGTRTVLILLGVVAMVAIVIPLLGAESLRDSRTAASSGDLKSALDDANRAHSLQPYAAEPDLQQALVLELMGSYRDAVDHAREATQASSRDWRTWLILSRLQVEANEPAASVNSYLHAKSLNPRSPLFASQ